MLYSESGEKQSIAGTYGMEGDDQEMLLETQTGSKHEGPKDHHDSATGLGFNPTKDVNPREGSSRGCQRAVK